MTLLCMFRSVVMLLCCFALVTLAADLEDRFHFVQGQHREEPGEQQIEREEDPDRTEEYTHINPCRVEHGPAARQVIAMEAGNDDHESLEPHPDVHYDAHDEGE